MVGENKIENMNQVQPTTMNYLGKEGEDPSTPFWTSGKYVGPYWSNGKLQESVEFGDETPSHELDALARLHDTAYARYKDEKHRAAADLLFAEQAEKLKSKYGPKWADDPKIASRLVQYGNHAVRAATRVGGNVSTGFKLGGPIGALGGLLYSGVQNIVQSHQMLKGTYLSKEKDDIRRLFASDPKTIPKLGNGKVSAPSGDSKMEPGPQSDPLEPPRANRGSVARAGPAVVPNAPSNPITDDVIQRQAARFRAARMKKTNKNKIHVQPKGVSKMLATRPADTFSTCVPENYKNKRRKSWTAKVLKRLNRVAPN